MFTTNKKKFDFSKAPEENQDDFFLLNGEITPKIYNVNVDDKNVYLLNIYTNQFYLKLKKTNLTINGEKVDNLTSLEIVNKIQKLVFRKGGRVGNTSPINGEMGESNSIIIEPFLFDDKNVDIIKESTKIFKFRVDNVQEQTKILTNNNNFIIENFEIIKINDLTYLEIEITAGESLTDGIIWLTNNNSETPVINAKFKIISVEVQKMDISVVPKELFVDNVAKYGEILFNTPNNRKHTIKSDGIATKINDGGGDIFDGGHIHKISTKISETVETQSDLIDIKSKNIIDLTTFKHVTRYTNNYVATIFETNDNYRFSNFNWSANWGADGNGDIISKDFVLPDFKGLVKVLNIYGSGDPSTMLIRIYLAKNNILDETDVVTNGKYLNTDAVNFNDVINYSKNINTIFSILVAKKQQEVFKDETILNFINQFIIDYYNL